MSGTETRLLIVDDEEVICQACRRLFSPQGFRVETSSDALEGLAMALEKDYAAILLDFKMPALNGIQFLEELRKTKADVPVILITAFPDISNASAGMRLGAADYVTKPFTPEEITQAVHRLIRLRGAGEKDQAAARKVEPRGPVTQDFRFWAESWLQPGKEGVVWMGAMPARSRVASLKAVQLPRIGETVYQGLPLAGVTVAGAPPVIVAAPVSGVVVSVNDQLAKNPAMLLDDPCGNAWIACACPTRFDEEVKRCGVRRIVLLNADEASARQQEGKLAALGCQVRRVRAWAELAPVLKEADRGVLLMDAASFGDKGPELAGQIRAAAAAVKIVVLAPADSKWEAAYRAQRIFYYAVEPFADNEITDILDAAFRPRSAPAVKAERGQTSSEPLSGVLITNRNGTRVRLCADSGLLRQDQGLGWQIRHTLLDRLFPVETISGDAAIGESEIIRACSSCDRVILLLAKNTGRLPGSLVRDTRGEHVPVSGENAGKVTTLLVQPPEGFAGGAVEFDERTTVALSEHIVQEMALS